MVMTCPSCKAENDDTAGMCFTCGRGLSGLTQGSVIASRYEILKPLGTGGMGMVYKAHDRELDETVAIKVLRGDVAKAPDMAKRFRSEIKLARKVRHPNVCGIHEYGQHGDLRFIAMEHIEGTDLKQEIRARGGLLPEDAYDVSIQVAKGLQAIHDAGIIHRDLKTQNIMRDSRGVIRLMDFGIAKQTGADTTTGATAAGQVVGTPEYMSPEQARGQRVDLRTDIYSLGVVVFEIFTGQVPFKGETPVATLFMQVQDPPPLEGPAAARVPPPLVPVLQKALAKNADERYATADEIAEALRQARTTHDAEASYAPTPEQSPTADLTPGRPRIVVHPTGTTVAVATTRAKATARPTAPAHTPRPRERQPLPIPMPPAPRRGPWILIASALVAVGGLTTALWRLSPSRAGPAPPATSAPGSVEMHASPTPTATNQPVAERSPDASEMWIALPTTVPATLARPKPNPAPIASPSTIFQARAGLPPKTLPASMLHPSPTMEPMFPTTTLAAASTPTPFPVAVTQPAAAPSTAPPVEDRGFLQLVVVPFADATVDDRAVGRVTSNKISLAAGNHVVVLNHPDYQPLRRKITIGAGETLKLIVDMAEEAVRKKK